MLLYYITDRRQFAGSDAEQCRGLLAKIAEASRAGVDFIQLREKDLGGRALCELAREALEIVSSVEARRTKLLLNSRTDIALAAAADGVHLTSTDIAASEARAIWAAARPERSPIIAVSCHSAEEVKMAASHGADFTVLAPIFEKVQTGSQGIGVKALRASVGRRARTSDRTESAGTRAGIPILALGGITLKNAKDCVRAGAAGIAAIRLFQDANVEEVVKTLRPRSEGEKPRT